MKTRIYLIIEFLLLFCFLPVVLYIMRFDISHKVVIIVMLFAIGCMIYLLRDRRFNSRAFVNTAGIGTHLKKILATFIIPAFLMGLFTYFFLPHRFLAFPKESLLIWLVVLILYPVLAAYPQEIIFRGFFFHRYQPLFSKPTTMLAANAVCFGLAHLLYGNWVAPLLSTAGGFLFAYRYLKSGSLLTVGIEHGLWGNFLFTIGIGWYFHSGTIQVPEWRFQ